MNSNFSPLSDVADVIDSLHKTPAYSDSGPPMVRVTDVKYGYLSVDNCLRVSEDTFEEFSRRYKPKPGDIVITRVGSYGNTALVNNTKFCLGQNTAAIIPKTINNRYLYAALNSPQVKAEIDSQVVGSTQKTLSLARIKALKIPRHPHQSEENIANLIGSLDDRITLLRETNKTLEAIAQAIFKSWFVDFDPVRAKMEGRQPEGMDEATAALFPDSFEESELGLVPKGWKLGKTRDLGEVVCGKTPPTKDVGNYGKDVPFITIPDMHGNLLITATARSLSKKGADSQAKKYLREGTVCVSCIATPGLVSQITFEAQTNQQINSVIPFMHWGDSFVLFALKLIGNSVRIAGSGGSVFHNLSKSGFEELKVLLPTIQTAQQYNSITEPLIKKITINQYSIQHLCDLRDTLLPRLISGQLRLPEAQKQLESA